MRVIYAETSAVLTWLLGEDASQDLAATIDGAEKIVSSVLSVLEAERGILRARLDHRIHAADGTRLKGLLARTAAQWDLMEITPEIRTRASEALPVEPVRTLDAIHLATALEFAKVYPKISVLSSDHRILSNLAPLGLAVAGLGR